MTADTTLYAGWTGNSYTVHFEGNGGTGTMPDQPRKYDDKNPLTTNTFINTGHQFTGWNTKTDASGDAFTDQDTKDVTSQDNVIVTLYAMWDTVQITPNELPEGQVNVPYDQTLTATGTSGAVSWSVSAGTLPAGLDLASGSGVISGKPTKAGGNDGSIGDVNATMEWSADGGASWTDCPASGTITGLKAGTYWVRVKETADAEAGEHETVTLAEGAHRIDVKAGTGGSAWANTPAGDHAVNAEAGATVTVVASPDLGYELERITWSDGTSMPDVTTTKTFTMPSADATVNVSFKKIIYMVTAVPATNGTLTATPTSATVGETITVTAKADTGYELESLTYTPEGGAAVDIMAAGMFTMPAADVRTPWIPRTLTPTLAEVISNDGRTLVLLILDANGKPLAEVRLWFWLELLKDADTQKQYAGATETPVELAGTHVAEYGRPHSGCDVAGFGALALLGGAALLRRKR